MAHVTEIRVMRRVSRNTNTGWIVAEAGMTVSLDKDDTLPVKEAFEMAWNNVNEEVVEQMGLDDTPKK